MRCTNSYGVSEVVGLVLVATISISAISLVVFWGIPYIDAKKISVRIDSALTQFKTINDAIQRVSSEGINRSERVDFVTDAGEVNINKGERFILYYSVVGSLTDAFDFSVKSLDNDDNTFTIQVNKIPLTGNPWDNDHYLVVDVYYIDEEKSDRIVPQDQYPITNSDVSYTYDSSRYDLDTAIKIDIKLVSSLGAPEPDIFVGRIWLFDVGSISYYLSTPKDTYNVVAENEGVTRVSSGSGYLYYTPKIYHKDDSLTFRITRLVPRDVTGISGMSKCTLQIKCENSSVMENKIHIPISLKIEIYGDERITAAWTDYFTSKIGFTETNGILNLRTSAPDRAISFTLVYSVCEVSLMV